VKDFWREFSAECLRKLSEFNQQNLANTAFAIGKLGVGMQSLAEKFWAFFTTECVHKFPEFSPQDLSNTAYALCLLGVRQEFLVNGFWFAFSRECLRKRSGFIAQDLENTALALSVLGVPQESLANQFWRTFSGDFMLKFADFIPLELSRTVYAFGVLALPTKALADGFWEALMKDCVELRKLSNFNSRDLADCLFAAALLSCTKECDIALHVQLVAKFMEALNSLAHKASVRDVRRAHQAALLLDLKLPAKLAQRVETDLQPETAVPSRLCQRVSNALRVVNVDSNDMCEEYFDPIIRIAVDIALPSKRVAVFVDDPTRLTANGTLNALNRLASALFSKQGWRVVRISDSDIELRSDDQLVEFVRSLSI